MNEEHVSRAGWYSDPENHELLRYWDGRAWTDQRAPAPPPPRTPPSSPPPLPAQAQPGALAPRRIAIALGGALLAMSPFVTWYHVVLLGNISLRQDVAGQSQATTLLNVITIAGLATVVAALIASNFDSVAAWSVPTGVVAGVILGNHAWLLYQSINQTAGVADLGPGPIIAIAGCLMLVLPAFVKSSQRHRNQGEIPPQVP